MNITLQQLKDIVLDVLPKNQHINLSVPIMPKDRQKRGEIRDVEIKSLPPEVNLPYDYAQWATCRPIEQILKGSQTDHQQEK